MAIDYALWELTQRCNLSCLHCRASANPDLKEKNIIEGSSIYKVVDELVSVGCPVLALTGGEPLLRKDIVDIVSYANSKGIRVRIQTNGLLLNPKLLSNLKKAGIFSIGIGLDGSSSKNHDLIRNKNGAFRKAISKIKLIKDMKMSVHVEYTVTSLNINDLGKTLDLLEALKVDTFLARSVLFSGRAKISDSLFRLDPQEYFKFLRNLQTERKKRKIVIYCQDPLFNQVVPGFRKRLSKKYGNLKTGKILTGCTVGLNMIHIRKNGDIGVCTFLPNITLGNILHKPLRKIWQERKNSDLLKRMIERDYSGNCGDCPDKYICGGCRARAMIINNDPLAEDPYCLRNYEDQNKKSQ